MRAIALTFSGGLLLGLLAASCGPGQHGCRSDSECGNGAVCFASGGCGLKCTTDAQCGQGGRCSPAGGCVLAANGCGTDAECSSGKVCEGVSCIDSCASSGCLEGGTCNPNGHCSNAPSGGVGGGSGAGGGNAGGGSGSTGGGNGGGGAKSCGGELFQASKVQANFLIVLDRSGSMSEKINNVSKWSLAKTAVTTVTSQHEQVIRFGLNMFPGSSQCTQGSAFVPVGDAKAMEISAALPATATGSGTPIGAALKLAATNPALSDATRANFVLLVTDGMENCNGNPVNEVKTMFAKGVRTYVVGFGADVDAARLNQLAVEGGTARLGNTRYYQADDGATLQAAFAQIAQGASGCDFKLATPPADLSKIFVAVDGTLVPRDTSHKGGWDYQSSNQRLTLYGPACDLVQKSASPKVQIVYGCPDPTIIEGGGNQDGGTGSYLDGGFPGLN